MDRLGFRLILDASLDPVDRVGPLRQSGWTTANPLDSGKLLTSVNVVSGHYVDWPDHSLKLVPSPALVEKRAALQNPYNPCIPCRDRVAAQSAVS
jgi:hypothetical protein